jgi:hypothetical protein
MDSMVEAQRFDVANKHRSHLRDISSCVRLANQTWSILIKVLACALR